MDIKRRFSGLLLLVCLIVTSFYSSSSSAGPLDGRPPWWGWFPILAVVTSATSSSACSQLAASHKETLKLPPDQNVMLSVEVHTDVLEVGLVQLHYSLNGGIQEVRSPNGITTSGTSTTYSFTIPASSLPDGTVIDYAFEIVGTFLVSECLGFAGAVVPSADGFHSIATDADTHGRILQDAAFYAGLVATNQPEYAGTDADTICSGFFAAPTLCDLYPEIPDTELDGYDPDTLTSILPEVISSGVLSGLSSSCTFSGTPGWNYNVREESRQANPGGDADNGIAPAYNDNSIVQYSNAINNPAGNALNGSSRASMRGEAGYHIGFTGGEGVPSGASVLLQVSISFYIYGESEVLAATSNLLSNASASASAYVDGAVQARGSISSPLSPSAAPETLTPRYWDAIGAEGSSGGARFFPYYQKTQEGPAPRTISMQYTVQVGNLYGFVARLYTNAAASGVFGAGGAARSTYWKDDEVIVSGVTVPTYKLRVPSVTLTILTSGYYFSSCE